MGFVTKLVVEEVDLGKPDDWRTVEPLVYRGNHEEFTVEPGKETDFASVPFLFRWLIPRSGRHTKAAVLHDNLWRDRRSSYQDADGIFRRALHETDVPFLRRWTMWAAVRWASLFKSRFRDGLGDLPLMLLVLIFPGAVVIAGGLVILPFLVAFWALEIGAGACIYVLRKAGMTERVKPYRPPALIAPAASPARSKASSLGR